MSKETLLSDPQAFSAALFEIMKRVEPRFRRWSYTNSVIPSIILFLKRVGPALTKTWDAIELLSNSDEFYDRIKIKEQVKNRIVLDKNIIGLTNMLFVGLLTGAYDEGWVQRHFYFDVRGFFSYIAPDTSLKKSSHI